MAASTLANIAFVLKKKFSGSKPSDLAMRDHPTASMMRKEGGMSGLAAGWAYAVRYGNPQGISGTFADSQTAASSSKGVQFLATRCKKYGNITIDGEALAACRDNQGAFLELVSSEVGGIIEEHGDDLAWQLFRDGNPARGQRSSASTNVITLATADDSRNFKVGMTVEAGPNADGSSLRTGNTTVAEIDEDAGTVTLTSAAAITSFADNDYLFRLGDDGSNTMVDGFESIIPLSAPSSGESFRGVDRSVHTRLLAGVRVDDTGTVIEENAGLVCVKIAQSSKRPARGTGVVVLNPINFWAVARRLNAKVTYDGGGHKATYGFEGFDISTPAGTLRAISDPDCPSNRGRVLSLKTWYWKTLLDWVHIVQDDKAGPTLRIYNEDSVEGRTRSMGNVICTDPGGNGVFSI